MKDEALSNDFERTFENKDDSEHQVNFFKLEVTLGPVSWPFYAFVVVLQAEHDRIRDDYSHDETVECVPFDELHDGLSEPERAVKNEKTAGV